jgi:hypothetical protein
MIGTKYSEESKVETDKKITTHLFSIGKYPNDLGLPLSVYILGLNDIVISHYFDRKTRTVSLLLPWAILI